MDNLWKAIMDNYIHRQATKLAIESLPQREQKFLKKIKKDMIYLYSLYPDIYKWKIEKAVHDNAVRYSHLPIKETSKYSILPGGKEPDFYSHKGLKEVLHFYIKRMYDCLKKGNMTMFAKYAGSYSHYLADVISPAHIKNTAKYMPQLLPPPEDPEYVYISDHWIIEMIPFKLETFRKYRPKFFATTIDGVIFFLKEEWLRCINFAVSQHIPLMQALYRKDTGEVDRIKRNSVKSGIKVLADTLHTLLCLTNKYPGKIEIRKTYLTDILPVRNPRYDPMYRGLLIRNNSISGVNKLGWKKAPLKLIVNKRGKNSLQKFKKGIGMGIPTEAVYFIDGVFKKFEAMIGFHPELSKKGIGRFRIFGDGRKIFDSAIMREGEVAKEIDVDITGVKKFEIRAEEVEVRYGMSGWHTEDHLVLAEPVLFQ